MRLCRFDDNRLGVVEGAEVRDVTEALDALPPLAWPVPAGDHLIANLPAVIARIATLSRGRRTPLAAVRLLSPVANPAHIVAAPLNYRLHVEEASSPAINHGVHMPGHEGFATPIDKYGLFLKSPTGIVGAGEGVAIHFPGRRNDHEVELAAVIGRGGKDIAREDALAHVAGYAIGLDITVRGPEDRSYRKSADSYSVLGPCLVTADEIADPGRLALEISVDGALRQKANTADLIVALPDLIARASRVFALCPGDVIMTGTPEGVGEIWPGAVMHAAIEGIGEMTVAVR